MNYEQSVGALIALGRELASPQQARVMKFELTNIRTLAEALGNPQRAMPCAHIAGTNGKGSTAAMLESILRTAGIRTGLYTSPHLERINERIRINGEEVADDVFAAAWRRVQKTVEEFLAKGELAAHPSFFECVTAMGFLIFAEQKVEFAVYEVGLGGRLDATNIVEPQVAMITPVDFDHESFLGHSIEEIAGEKAGIIKHGVPVVSAAQRPEAAGVIKRRAQGADAPLTFIPDVWVVNDVTNADGLYRATAERLDTGEKFSIAPSLPGRFQIDNALMAATAAKLFQQTGISITREAVVDGIRKAQWPGRLEQLQDKPLVYLDGAHNPSAARELAKFWAENFAGRRIWLVYGAMRDKAVDEIAGLLFPLVHHVILTQPLQPRAVSAQVLAEMTADLTQSVSVIPDPSEALEDAIANATPEDVIFASGSLFLVGDLRKYWHSRAIVRAG
jgi:dihydrofolate synthase/folylpolyglutamate synthase